jgi:hypothetical protein
VEALVNGVLDLELPELSDAELAFLEGGERVERLVDLTTLAGLDDEAWEQAVSDGLRSLLDRRLISTAEEPTEPPRLRAELQTILSARSLPWLVVLLERVHEERRSSWSVYGVEQGVMLVETIVEPGRHAFRLCAAELAASWLASFADPDDAARQGGEELESREAVEGAVGTPQTLTRILAVRRADDDRPTEWEASLTASPTGLWAIVEGADGAVTGWSLSADDRSELFGRLLDPDRA